MNILKDLMIWTWDE